MLPERMLKALGISSPDELFDDIPEGARVTGLELPSGLEERELMRHLDGLLSRNRPMRDMPSFLGGGVYRHFVPAAVHEIVSRSEFYTSYTPYQAEASQGMLQAMFEYQSFMTELTGMDAVNSSMYDWSTALGEAALMCSRLRRGRKFLISEAISPQRKAVLRTYLRGIEAELQMVRFDIETGRVDLGDLRSKLDDEVFGVYLENPNYFGVMEEEAEEISASVGDVPLVIGANPLSLAIMKPPSEYGADIVIGEGQPLGSEPNLGGPLLGIFGCRREHIRKMPGRMIGLTIDAAGKRAFCMTLRTREQDIRRGKATSNICTNEALMALAACAYIALLGRSGLIATARECMEKAERLSGMISGIDGFKAPLFSSTHFNEFVMSCPTRVKEVHRGLLEKGMHGGISLKGAFPELGEAMLLSVTEMHGEDELESLARALEGLA